MRLFPVESAADALLRASVAGRRDIVERIFRAGLVENAKSLDEALTLARLYGHDDIVNLIEEEQKERQIENEEIERLYYQ